jgi:uncharacterized lipoprotein YmbA
MRTLLLALFLAACSSAPDPCAEYFRLTCVTEHTSATHCDEGAAEGSVCGAFSPEYGGEKGTCEKEYDQQAAEEGCAQ